MIDDREKLKREYSYLGKEINLLKQYPQSRRSFDQRGKRKIEGEGYITLSNDKNNDEVIFDQLLLKKAREFGKEYFDGDRLYYEDINIIKNIGIKLLRILLIIII